LGWLLTDMIIGPHALNWMDSSIIDAQWFHILSNIGEVFVGMLIGTELILKELKKSGKQILIICLFEGITAFIFVSVAFFIFADIPMSIALVFGAIALATAPAPSLSIVKEYNAQGPVSKTLIPLAALDDILALIVFFLVIGLVSGSMTGEGVNVFAILMMIVLPLALGAITGLIGAKVLKKECNKWQTILKVTALIILTVAIGVYINENILSINLVLSGISFAAFIANMVEEERLNEIMKDINPIISIALVLVILDLGAPLDYNLIFGAGLLTAIYIISRGLGKIVGSYTGGKISKKKKNVCKYLGLSLLPHSGVSLIFTGIAVSTLSPYVPEHAAMIQGTIAAAAVINEIIAVFLAKQAFKMSGEIKLEKKERLDEVIN
ncbi:MAG: cation:proton antiporter, partial [Peptostreptococcaceae bacterium]|nr:cation:proton antiporter [Peptostreptococcaceae bacterium]